MANVLTFDLETENNKYNKRLASPFDPRNYIVQIGWSINGGKCHEKYYTAWHREKVLPSLKDIDVINGFNIKFDLLWVWTEEELTAFFKKGGTIYCGQYAEYLLEGMNPDSHMAAMNDIAENYGGGCKIDAVKEMWQAGVLTSQIPRDLLTDYLIGDGKDIVGDVQNTWLIYVGQIQRMLADHPEEFRTMVKFRMDGLLATTEMEYNGMFVDKVQGEKDRTKLAARLVTAKEELETFIPELPPELEFNWGSPTHKSCLIFGGVVRYKKWLQHTDDNGNGLFAKKETPWPMFTLNGDTRPVDPKFCKLAGDLYVFEVPPKTKNAFKYTNKKEEEVWYLPQNTYLSGKKAGEAKFKQMEEFDYDKPKGAKQWHYFKFDGYTQPSGAWRGESTDAYDNPLYSVAADVIEKLSERGLPFTDALAAHTSIAKDLTTYYWSEDKKGNRKGMLTLVQDDGIIHHKLNHTSTVTSRMSSSDPNLQVLPRKDEDDENKSTVKKLFISRWGNDGEMAEIDYSQLEVVIQAVLSGDKQMIEDLNNKIDFHCKRLAIKEGKTYEEVIELCKVLKLVEWITKRTGSKVFSFQRAYGAGVDAVAKSTGMSKDEVESLIKAEDHWDSPTGTRYTWREGVTPEFMHKHGKYVGFSPPERKNYPVQGFGGEVVQTMLGKVFRHFIANDRFNGDVVMVNTVHDCMLLDGKKEGNKLRIVAKQVQGILEDVPETFNKAYPNTLNITVPFPCETEVGNDLYTMDELH